MTYGFLEKLNTLPTVTKLTLIFSLLISVSLTGFGRFLINTQTQTQQKQTAYFTHILATQTAYRLESAMVLQDTLSIAKIANQLLTNQWIVGVTVYDADKNILGHYAVKHQNNLHIHTVPVFHNLQTIGSVSILTDDSTLHSVHTVNLKKLWLFSGLLLSVNLLIYFTLINQWVKPLDDSININHSLLRKDKIETVFSRYVSPQVAQQVLKDLDGIETVELGGQHLMASVFFADIVGFTSLSERLDPQQISVMLNVYFAMITEVVSFCGGHIDKFIGDCAMVVFGVPVQTRQHTFDCLACGWMILQLITQLNEKRESAGEITVEFRIGANSGMMLAGNMGSEERMEYTVVGDSVNLASRLSGAAEPGELVITEEVFVEQGLEGLIETCVKDLIKIRGKRLPVTILSVTDILSPFKAQMLAQIPLIIAGQNKTPQPKKQTEWV